MNKVMVLLGKDSTEHKLVVHKDFSEWTSTFKLFFKLNNVTSDILLSVLTDHCNMLQQLQASYSFYTWPCAPVLAWFLWERRAELLGKHIVELGAGTALPGIVAAKCGASVTLTESATLPKSIQHLRRCCELNNLLPNQVRIVGLTWGLFLANTFNLGPIDLIIGSDCFYEPSVFENIIVTVAFLLENNPHARFYCVYQERSADWSIEHLLHKWSLRCQQVPLNNLGVDSGIDVNDLMKSHTIHLLEITRI